MTRAHAEAMVWAAFPRRSSARWTLVLEKHHTSTPKNPIWRWFLDGKIARQDRYERQGFVDRNGVEMD